MIDTSIQVKTDQFDGPLGLLLHLLSPRDENRRTRTWNHYPTIPDYLNDEKV
jgi:hypothetical protein